MAAPFNIMPVGRSFRLFRTLSGPPVPAEIDLAYPTREEAENAAGGHAGQPATASEAPPQPRKEIGAIEVTLADRRDTPAARPIFVATGAYMPVSPETAAAMETDKLRNIDRALRRRRILQHAERVGTLAPDAFQAMLDTMGIGRNTACQALEISADRLRRMLAGKVPIPRHIGLACAELKRSK